MFANIVLIIGGLFACYGLIVANAPSIKDEFDAVIPYQGAVGILLIMFGLRDLFYIIPILKGLSVTPILSVLNIIVIIIKFILGFVLSFGLLTKYVFSAPTQTKDASKKIYKQLVMIQVPAGILAVILGTAALMMRLFL